MAKKSQTDQANDIKAAAETAEKPRPGPRALAPAAPSASPKPPKRAAAAQAPSAPNNAAKLAAIIKLREEMRPIEAECEQLRLEHLKKKHEADEMAQKIFALIDDDGSGTLFPDEGDEEAPRARSHDDD